MKEFWLDVETTGLSHRKNFVHQVAIIVVIDGKVEGEFDFKVKPPYGTIIDSRALAVSNVKRSDIEKYPDYKQTFSDILSVMLKYVDVYDHKDKFTVFGYNVNFDIRFMKAYFTACSNEYYSSWFWSNYIDVKSVAGRHLKHERHKMRNFRLGTVYEYMGLTNVVDWHDALGDITATREIYLNCGDEHKEV